MLLSVLPRGAGSSPWQPLLRSRPAGNAPPAGDGDGGAAWQQA
jgi:hypothetical protein